MKQLITTGIILARTDYGEADRILTLLTPDYGKLRLMARGVRKIKSKLAGGIELFSVSNVSFVKGRGEMGTLVSTRLIVHYGHIVKNLERTMLGYELIKKLNKATEDAPEPAYFELLHQVFQALDDDTIPLPLVHFWFTAQILRLGGHTPNLQMDERGRKLVADQLYDFDFDRMNFVANPLNGRFSANHIKFLRLVFVGNVPKALMQVQGITKMVNDCAPLIQPVL